MSQVEEAREAARELLAEPLPRRWAHTQGVAGRARFLRSILGENADLVETAAWLHDIGYSPSLATTGFHPLDGARYLRDAQDFDEVICRLVAHHSCAAIEAEERNLQRQLTSEFEPPGRDLLDALTFCDMTTSPDGSPTSAEERIVDIAARYGEEQLVGRSIRRATPQLLDSVQRVIARL